MGIKEDVNELLDADLGLDELENDDSKDEDKDQDKDLDQDKDKDKGDTDEAAETLRRSIEESYDTPPKEEKAEKKDEKQTKLEIGDETFFTGDVDALEDLIKNPKGFNDLLNAIYKKAVEAGHNKSVESVLRSLPETIKNQVIQHITVTTSVKEFYQNNEDLVPYKKTVGAIANQVSSTRPDLPLPKIMELTAKLARKKLNLIEKAKDQGGDKNKGKQFPNKPTGSRSSRIKEEPTGLDKEIDDMLKIL
jgi:hypothetical protein